MWTTPRSGRGPRRSRSWCRSTTRRRDLEASIRRLHGYLTASFPLPWIVTIADNASTDRTWGIACRLAGELDGVNALHLDQKGRGRALREAWTRSAAPRRRLHGRRPLDRPRRAASSRRAARDRPQRRRHRHAPGAGLAGRARPEARGDLARLQPAPPHDVAERVLRRPVRLQGDPDRRRAHPAARRRGPELVLRHRAARARGAGRAPDPRGAGRLGRRSRLPGRRRRHRARRPQGRLAHGEPFASRGFSRGSVPARPRLQATSRATSAASSCGSPRSAS